MRSGRRHGEATVQISDGGRLVISSHSGHRTSAMSAESKRRSRALRRAPAIFGTHCSTSDRHRAHRTCVLVDDLSGARSRARERGLSGLRTLTGFPSRTSSTECFSPLRTRSTAATIAPSASATASSASTNVYPPNFEVRPFVFLVTRALFFESSRLLGPPIGQNEGWRAVSTAGSRASVGDRETFFLDLFLCSAKKKCAPHEKKPPQKKQKKRGANGIQPGPR